MSDILIRNVELPDWAYYFELTFEPIDENQKATTAGIVHENQVTDLTGDLFDELNKANKTIEELMAINEQLGGYNNNTEKARLRIIELENKLKKAEDLNIRYQRKLTNRKYIIKESIKEVLIELLNTLTEEE